MQTNLTLLTPEVVDLFDFYGATIGVSLDGSKEANDRHRLDYSGCSTFERVEAGMETLCTSEKGRRVISGILAVIDLANDPVETYQYLSSFRPRTLDFLLPDATHERYPPGKQSFGHTPYADWLIDLFDYWWQEKEPSPIRFFDNIIALVLDGKCDTEYLGLNPVDLIVVEADGSLEAVDTLKVAYDGAPELAIDVFRCSFDDALRHPAIASRMAGTKSRSPQCQICPLLRICGGGYLPHRFSRSRGFLNPSVYCHDLAKIILHVRRCVYESLKTIARKAHCDNGRTEC